MQIHLAHDRPVLIRIARDLLRSVPSRDAQMVGKVARRAQDGGAKESVLLNSFCYDRLVGVSIQYDFDLARVGAKDADFQILANPMRPQHAEWIGMRSSDEIFHLIRRHSRDFKRFS